ncbi:Reverse transcriptase (RNA-dependent DNA polymerase) [Fragilaria crotonensis]|nr:Reverse transcriptase (RNA-dependent DNA polymerase) [Fragilaria crotonensis]
MKEFAQLEDQDVYEAIHASSLTKEQRKAVIRALNLIQEKRDGSLKGRTVADGRLQRGLYDKSQTASPTVSTDALILSIIIDAYERRDLGTADVAGAFLKALMDDFVVMKFTGKSVDILCTMNPRHKEFVVYKTEQKYCMFDLRRHLTGQGTAVITMKEYLKEALLESGMNITGAAATPSQWNLFEVNEQSPMLESDEAEAFHKVAAKLLYVAIRARVDLLLAIAFLCTRVSKSTQQDRSKLKRVLEYINGSMDMENTVGADDMGRMRTWVDASFAVHPDMKSHTGGVISFGTGGIICKSTKQKLNTKSSTEAEFVGASDYLPNTLWVKMFLEAQGYTITDNIFEQDNESAIKLETNGRISAGPKSRHIDIRYFWIKDRIKSAGVQIQHCPTLEMLADFFTKPLQGHLFRTFRDVLLDRAHVNSLASALMIPIEERVGEVRFDSNKDGATVANDTVNDSTVQGAPHNITWADVVRKVQVPTNAKSVELCKFAVKEAVMRNNKRIVSGSLSRNNPINRSRFD